MITLRHTPRPASGRLSSLIPSVSCRRCSPDAPFAKLEMLTAERPDSTDHANPRRGGDRVKPKQPTGPSMTLGNMREQGVRGSLRPASTTRATTRHESTRRAPRPSMCEPLISATQCHSACNFDRIASRDPRSAGGTGQSHRPSCGRRSPRDCHWKKRCGCGRA